MNLLKPLGLGLALILVVSCSLDYEQARMAESIPGQIPETILFDFTHTVVSGGRIWVVLEAERAETYSERKEIVLQGVSFREYDEQGNLLTEAQAERAVFNTDSEDATVSGAIVIYSPEEKASLQAGRLSWIREGRRLVADDGQAVRLQKDDGSFVEGRGFSADFRRKKLEFSSRVRGSYVREEEK
ncbi:MAG: LPS export ABC transporter periplasmic protein LptC [Spirochaetaceae bacterium]|nr:MAG: LPS export ABC transporter periplasmic protein LptC [Spirochaetaceae bacterium]